VNAEEGRWCDPATKAGRLRRAVLEQLRVHERAEVQRDEVAARLSGLLGDV
jgi:hypothetical protein